MTPPRASAPDSAPCHPAMATETELKLALVPAAIPALLAHPLLAAAPPQQTRLANTYFDTPDLALLARRFAIRLRKAGRRRLVTIKGEAKAPGGLSRRAEWEAEVPGDVLRFDHVDAPELRAELTALLPCLRPVFSTDFLRLTWQVRRGVSTIEVAFDRGRILAVPEDGDPARPLREAICEVELELLEGQDDDLLALAEALAATLPLLPAPASKAERGYRLYRRERPVPVKVRGNGYLAAATPLEAFRGYAFACLESFNRNAAGFLSAHGDKGAGTTDPEFIHQARVALRRLRSALRLFADALPPDYLARWQPALAALANALGPAREWQVLADDLRRHPSSAQPPRQLARLLAHLARHERQALAHARKVLAAADTTHFVLGFLRATLALPPDQTAAFPGKTAGKDAAPGASRETVASRALRRAGKSVQRRLARLQKDATGAADRPEALASDWHRLRIAIKRLRYSLDALAAQVRPRDLKAWNLHLLPLQDALGQLNDSAVGIAHLRASAPRPDDPLVAPAIARLEGRADALFLTLPTLVAPLANLEPPRLKKSGAKNSPNTAD